MRATVRKWGNSAAIRLPKEELARLGVRVGQYVEVRLTAQAGEVDLSALPVFEGLSPMALGDLRKLRGQHAGR